MVGCHLAHVIPFKFQGREGLGFLASVNLGFDTRMISALSVVDGRLFRFHDAQEFVRTDFRF
jgi:hypothetical protein